MKSIVVDGDFSCTFVVSWYPSTAIVYENRSIEKFYV